MAVELCTFGGQSLMALSCHVSLAAQTHTIRHVTVSWLHVYVNTCRLLAYVWSATVRGNVSETSQLWLPKALYYLMISVGAAESKL